MSKEKVGADGFRKFVLDIDDTVTVKKSGKTLRLYGSASADFLRVLQQKMM